jgi:translation initiation factor IF-2
VRPAAPRGRTLAHPDRPRRGGQDPGRHRRRRAARRGVPGRGAVRRPGAGPRPGPGGPHDRAAPGSAGGWGRAAPRPTRGVPAAGAAAAGPGQLRAGGRGGAAGGRPARRLPGVADSGHEPDAAAGLERAGVPAAAAGPRGGRRGRVGGGSPVRRPGAGRQARLRPHRPERLGGGRGLPAGGRAAAGDRVGRRPGQGAAAGGAPRPAGAAAAAAERRRAGPAGPPAVDARDHRLEPRPAVPGGAGAVPPAGRVRRRLHPGGGRGRLGRTED